MGGVQIESQSFNAVLRSSHTSGVLSLTNRNLSQIPLQIFSADLDSQEKFWECVPLSKLDLSFNQITSIPNEISTLEELLSMKIRSNNLNELNTMLFESCIMLKQLDVGQNHLTNVSEKIGHLQQLIEFSAPENKINSLPSQLEMCKQLQILNLYSNNLTSLPELDLPNLVQINVGKNKLRGIPQSFANCKSIEVFICCRNQIQHLPDLTYMRSLKVVDAMENRIEVFPLLPSEGNTSLSILNLGYNFLHTLDDGGMGSILDQTNLAELHLQNNKIKLIQTGLSLLSQLKLVDISNNELTDCPYDLGYLEALQNLILDGNPIRSIRRTLITRADSNMTADLKKFLRSRGEQPFNGNSSTGSGGSGGSSSNSNTDVSALEYRIRDIAEGGILNLAKFGLPKIIPDNVIEMLFNSHTLSSLTSMDFSGNSIEIIPSDFRNLGMLKELNLASNKLAIGLSSGYFETAWCPSSLRVLDVSNNGLTSRQAEILVSNAQCLLCLKMGRNGLVDLPVNIVHISNLRELEISYNQITSLNTIEWTQLPLEVLDASNNQLETLGGNLPKNNCLRVVNLSNNNISEVPYGFGFIECLQALSLQGNPLRGLTQMLINGNIERLKQSLRNKAP